MSDSEIGLVGGAMASSLAVEGAKVALTFRNLEIDVDPALPPYALAGLHMLVSSCESQYGGFARQRFSLRSVPSRATFVKGVVSAQDARGARGCA